MRLSADPTTFEFYCDDGHPFSLHHCEDCQTREAPLRRLNVGRYAWTLCLACETTRHQAELPGPYELWSENPFGDYTDEPESLGYFETVAGAQRYAQAYHELFGPPLVWHRVLESWLATPPGYDGRLEYRVSQGFPPPLRGDRDVDAYIARRRRELLERNGEYECPTCGVIHSSAERRADCLDAHRRYER